MIIYMFLFALMSLAFEYKHLLASVICLEFLALILFFKLIILCWILQLESIYSLFYLSIAVCEATLGVVIIILYTHMKGNEMFKSY